MLAGGCKRWQLSSGISTYCASKEDDASVNKLFMQLYLFSQLGVTSPCLPLSALQPMVTWALPQYCVTEALSSAYHWPVPDHHAFSIRGYYLKLQGLIVNSIISTGAFRTDRVVGIPTRDR